MKKFLSLLLAVFSLMACNSKPENTQAQSTAVENDKEILFIGTYTLKEGHVDGKGEGVYVYEMDKETGEITYVSTAEGVISPSYLAVHPNGQWVYAVNEFNGGDEEFATVTALNYDAQTKSLSFLSESGTLGQYPCHVSIDNSGNFVMAANYVGGSVLLYPIAEDGAVTESSSYRKHEGGSDHPRQEAAHAHQIVQYPGKDWVFAVDLGANKVYEYKLDTLSMTLDAVAEHDMIPKASGPRHMAFHPQKPFAYLLNELIGTVEVFPLSDEARFDRSIQVISTMAEGDDRLAHSAAIKVHPSGKFLYATNRGEVNDIVSYVIAEDGTLNETGRSSTQGLIPRDFGIDPSGNFLLVANQDSGNIVTFRINAETGVLEETGFVAEVPTPVCVKFLNGE